MKAACGVLTAKQAPHTPGTDPAHGLRAERAVVILSQTAKETTMCFRFPIRSRMSCRLVSSVQPSPRLSVEGLEDRTVPSTFTVQNLADSGLGSLRQAVLNANASPGADLIRFATAARDGTI